MLMKIFWHSSQEQIITENTLLVSFGYIKFQADNEEEGASNKALSLSKTRFGILDCL